AEVEKTLSEQASTVETKHDLLSKLSTFANDKLDTVDDNDVDLWYELTDFFELEKISEQHRIIGFRNILIHGYDIVDEAIVWQAVTNHLPILIREVKEILSA
ncbi:unnamed protein product, partial [marine sediment metagenome]